MYKMKPKTVHLWTPFNMYLSITILSLSFWRRHSIHPFFVHHFTISPKTIAERQNKKKSGARNESNLFAQNYDRSWCYRWIFRASWHFACANACDSPTNSNRSCYLRAFISSNINNAPFFRVIHSKRLDYFLPVLTFAKLKDIIYLGRCLYVNGTK